ncbi:MAG: RNA polymerase sigma factor [Bacteroidaceae bacterium]|nr:RNA polymerase sigma factor [Bacteroidaceae bacterium]
MSDLQKHSERELAEMLQRGDASVMGKLYACYANFLTAVCSRYIIDYEDTRDVLQESFIKIFTKGSSFKYREEGSLKAWLKQIVVNESLTFLKKKGRQGLVVFDEKLIPDVSEVPEEDMNILPKIPTDVLYQMIRALPPGNRIVFNLYAIEGRTHKEIAELLSIQETTSSSQLSRAKKMLAKKIKDYVTKKQEPR